jgi:hypothetical protein
MASLDFGCPDPAGIAAFIYDLAFATPPAQARPRAHPLSSAAQ